jgi:hypothetical protein
MKAAMKQLMQALSLSAVERTVKGTRMSFKGSRQK